MSKDKAAAPSRRGRYRTSSLAILLRCTYCHDGLRTPPVYCADCLAPHHGECFSEHGRCSAPGCGQVLHVRASARIVGGSVIWKLAFGLLLVAGLGWGFHGSQAGVAFPEKPVSVVASPPARSVLASVELETATRQVTAHLAQHEAIVLTRDDLGFTKAAQLNECQHCDPTTRGRSTQHVLFVVDGSESVWASHGPTRWQVTPKLGERVLLTVRDGRLHVSSLR